MQTATILLSLSGERDNQIPKYNVTPAEALLLRALHGDEAVTEIEVVGEKEATSRSERSRLFDFYSRANPRGGRACPELDALFPGSAARLPTTFDEIEFDDSFFKAERTAKAEPVDQDEDAPVKPKAVKAKASKAKKEEAKPADEAADAGEADGDAEQNGDKDENLFN